MTYKRTDYNQVFDVMRSTFGEVWYNSIDWPKWGIVWRSQIKRNFFDEGILISEMIQGLQEAAGKKMWPVGTAFFHRLHDVCLKNRREFKTVKIEKGAQSIGDILKERTYTT